MRTETVYFVTGKRTKESKQKEQKAKSTSAGPRLADELGRIKAEIADLQQTEKMIVAGLKLHGVAIYSGKLYDANIFASNIPKLDKDGLLKKYPKIADYFEEFTTMTPTLVCKVTARIARKPA